MRVSAIAVPLDLGRAPPWRSERLPLHERDVQGAVLRARHWLLQQQKPDGHWCPELRDNTILESEYALLMAFLGREREERVRKAANYVRNQLASHGAWCNY